MKRTLLTICICLLSVLAAGAHSTCETRVDAHPRATTRQRVHYCLTAPDETAYNNPGLVFSGVTTRHPAAESATDEPTAREGYFEQENIVVSRSLVDTRQFPEFRNKKLSEREVWEVHREAAAILDPALVPVEKQMEPLEKLVTETKAGWKARQTKPGRTLHVVVVEEDKAVTDLSTPATQEVVTDSYTYDSTTVQPYAPATQDAQEYVPAQQTVQPYAPAEQAELVEATASSAPAD